MLHLKTSWGDRTERGLETFSESLARHLRQQQRFSQGEMESNG